MGLTNKKIIDQNYRKMVPKDEEQRKSCKKNIKNIIACKSITNTELWAEK